MFAVWVKNPTYKFFKASAPKLILELVFIEDLNFVISVLI